MSGCFRNIGCVVVLVAVAAVAWLVHDGWFARFHASAPTAPAASTVDWEPLTPEGAARAREAVEKLDRKSGPVFTNLKAADLAAYVFEELSTELPSSASHLEAAVFDRKLWVRTSISIRDLGDAAALGPLSGVMGDLQPVEFGGTLDVVRRGLAEYRVASLKVADISIPTAAIPRLLRKIEQGTRPDGLADNALPLVVPPYIADVRIVRGKITLYKDVR
jgi:hypothetical protein